MQNNIQIDKRCQLTNTWLQIQFEDDITAELGNVIPFPHYHYFKGSARVYCWLISGWFDTMPSIRFLNDIIARFKITFTTSQYLKHTKDFTSPITPYVLKEFQSLKSKAKAIIRDKYSRVETHQDYVFMCIKLYAEDLIRADSLIIYDSLESWAFDNFIDIAKDKSTLRAKCRSVYNWYFDRDWQIGRVKTNRTKGDILATRQEHAKKIAKDKQEQARRKVLSCISGIFKDDYKKKDGSWNVSLIAKDTKLSRPTVMKYVPKESLF